MSEKTLAEHSDGKLLDRVRVVLSSQKWQTDLFCAAFGILVFVVFVRSTTLGDIVGQERLASIMRYVKLVVIFLLIVKFCFQGLDARRIIVTSVFVAFGLVVFMTVEYDDHFFFAFLFIGASRHIKVASLAKVCLGVTIPLFLLTIFLSLSDIIPSKVISAANGDARYPLGFTHPNTLGLMAIEMCLSFAVLRWGKNPLPVIVASIIGALFVFLVPHSRTAAIVIIFIAAVIVLCTLLRTRPRVLSALSMALLVFTLGFTYFAMVFYDPTNPVFAAIDNALSYRLSYLNMVFQNGVLPFGGTETVFPGTDKIVPLDMVFGQLLLVEGLVPTIVCVVLIALVLVKSYKERCFNAAVFGLVMFVFYGLSEGFIMQFTYDYFLIAMAPVLFGGSLSKFGPTIEAAYTSNRDKADISS